MLMLLNIHNITEKSLSLKLKQGSPDPVIGLNDVHTIRIADNQSMFSVSFFLPSSTTTMEISS